MFRKSRFSVVLFLGIALVVFVRPAKAQLIAYPDDSLTVVLFGPHGGYAFSGADLADRFGGWGMAGLNARIKFKSQWTLGLRYDYMFTGAVRENTIAHLQTPDGGVITADGSYSDFTYTGRGFKAAFFAGKIFSLPFGRANINSGLHLEAGAGLLQHKFRIKDAYGATPQLNADYVKGYDRLSNGLYGAIRAAYLYLDKRRYINFSVYSEIGFARTQNRRDMDFDKMQKDANTYSDLLINFGVSWVVPVYQRNSEELIIY